jgi:hypothetical protein
VVKKYLFLPEFKIIGKTLDFQKGGFSATFSPIFKETASALFLRNLCYTSPYFKVIVQEQVFYKFSYSTVIGIGPPPMANQGKASTCYKEDKFIWRAHKRQLLCMCKLSRASGKSQFPYNRIKA